MKFLLFIGLFILMLVGGVVACGVSILQAILRGLFGGSGSSRSKQTRTTHQTAHQSKATPQPEVKEKIIDSDEGEYVEFEEIKL
ncbi:MAG: DUF4834 family protein [Candidatus Symbiothrix sp.]|nr:DUF4834 family protein [Candidatus Symbiothrix sp.]